MIIGLSGKMGVGKTYVANRIVGWANFPCVRMAFGDELKRMASELYSFPERWAYERKDALVSIDHEKLDPRCINSEWGEKVSVRDVLQYYATEVVRRVDADFWIRQLNRSVHFLPVGTFIIVDDVRFPNELEYVCRHGVCYRINPYPGYKHPTNPHESETALDNAEFDGEYWPQFGKLDGIADGIITAVAYLSSRERKR